jgi:hypothetical protein
VKVNDLWDIFGGILLLALVATILTKKNTASDLNAAGNAFSGAIKQAQTGGG